MNAALFRAMGRPDERLAYHNPLEFACLGEHACFSTYDSVGLEHIPPRPTHGLQGHHLGRSCELPTPLSWRTKRLQLGFASSVGDDSIADGES